MRLIQVSTELNDFLAHDWYQVGQGVCLRRRVQYALKCSQEYVYGITSLTAKQADPHRLLNVSGGHWSIENRLHHRRDVALAEDARSGFAKVQHLMLLRFSTPLCSRSLIFARFPLSNGTCDAWMPIPFKLFAFCSSP
jgi:hypothetical protein